MYFLFYYINIFYNILDKHITLRIFRFFFMSSELTFFSCSYGDSVAIVFYGIFSVGFLEGSDLESALIWTIKDCLKTLVFCLGILQT